ncbi:MAG TPA: hypothetical protein VLA51_07615, partial [Paracoccaceae bacterium]|nr:hypothetical protein [Paracoccaceae bacterium]
VPKQGYRLVAGTDNISHGSTRPRVPKASFFAGAAIIAIIAISAWFLTPDRPEQRVQTRNITLAVLPFLNMSADVDQEYFSDGISEDLIVSLSKISDLRVLSRGASFSYKDKTVDIQTIGDALKADYIVDGSVRKFGDTLRISAQLVDAKTGANVWAERYEGDLWDVFEFQDRVLNALVKTLSVRLSVSERERLGIRGTLSVAAYDAYLQALQQESVFTKETNAEAERWHKEALRIDPQFAEAWAHLAQVYTYQVENHWVEDEPGTVQLAFDAANRAVAIDPDLPYAHFSMGRVYNRSFSDQVEKSIPSYERALELNPNYSDAKVFLGMAYTFEGQAERGLELIESVLAETHLAPFSYFQGLGMARYFTRDFDGAVEALTKASSQNPTAWQPYRYLIAAYGMLGQVDDAEWMAIEYEALGRTASVADIIATSTIRDPEDRALFGQGLRYAGLPEG